MTVREWDPGTASTDDIGAMVQVLNDALRADLPDDPPWESIGIREYLTETMPGERRVCWLAEAPEAAADRPIGGYANLLVLGDIGVLEVFVTPPARRHGIGRALVRAACHQAYQEGLASIGVEAIGGTPASAFWESLGFRLAYVEQRSVLQLSNVDWLKLGWTAGAVPDGYRVEYYSGGLPKELLDAYATAKATRRDPELPELELRPSSYDAQRLADSLDTLNRRGMKPYLVLAICERSGEVAGLTEVVAPAQHPSRAHQYDTIVVPHHQGAGLDRVIKARMLFELRSAEVRLTEVQTWNALENDPMAQVNAELGFLPDREWREYEADVLELRGHLP